MKTNTLQRDLIIISEVYPQHMGSMNELKRMIVQSKIGGADIVKLQLYSSKKLFGNRDREYLDTSKKELKEINAYCNNIGIELSASIFDEEKLDWCEELGFKTTSRMIQINEATWDSLNQYIDNFRRPNGNTKIKSLFLFLNYLLQN